VKFISSKSYNEDAYCQHTCSCLHADFPLHSVDVVGQFHERVDIVTEL